MVGAIPGSSGSTFANAYGILSIPPTGWNIDPRSDTSENRLLVAALEQKIRKTAKGVRIGYTQRHKAGMNAQTCMRSLGLSDDYNAEIF
jgi:hypothetical protein